MGGSAGGYRQVLVELIREKGLRHAEEPFLLASGELSEYFIDAKLALAQGRDLRLACEAVVSAADEEGLDFDAIGGLTLGADQFAHGVSIVADRQWFVIRKQPKGRGTNRWVEGAALGEGLRVVLVDDVVTTGGSMKAAYERIAAEGASVVFATALVDRGDVAAAFFAERGVRYRPLLTYADLGIPPVGGGAAPNSPET